MVMDDLEGRIDYAADLVDSLIYEAKRCQLEMTSKGKISSLEKNLIDHYGICSHNGATTSEFHKEICNYGKIKLLRPSMPAGCFGLPLGVSTATLGALTGSYQLLAVGGVVSISSVLFSLYSVRSQMKKRSEVIDVLFDIEGNRYILDGALKKLRDEK
jgi:hypothetical protein